MIIVIAYCNQAIIWSYMLDFSLVVLSLLQIFIVSPFIHLIV